MPGDAAGEHARIGSEGFAADESEAGTGERTHAEGFEDGDMGMAAAHQHQVFDDRRFRSLHGAMIEASGRSFKRYFDRLDKAFPSGKISARTR